MKVFMAQWINTGGLKQKHKKTDYPKAQELHHNVGTCLWHVSMQTAMYQRIGNTPEEPSLWYDSISI